MATALIPVFTGTIADRTAQLCDARTLHTFMQVKRDFSNWIKGRISKFGFVENEDYLLAKSGEQVLAKSGENLGGRPSIDYHLTLDMAKELAMVENNEQGRAARRYFIECERQALAMATPQPKQHNPAIDYDRISPSQAQDLKELVQSIVEAGIQSHGETWARLHRKFRVNSYLQLPATQHLEARQYLLGKLPCGYAATAQRNHLPPTPPGKVLVDLSHLASIYTDLGKLRRRVDALAMPAQDTPPSWWQQQTIGA